jgi:hypothetical protein
MMTWERAQAALRLRVAPAFDLKNYIDTVPTLSVGFSTIRG